MSDPVTAAMIGAGVSGGTSLLQGKKLGTSLRNAAIGGALGGAGSYLGGAMGGVGGAKATGVNTLDDAAKMSGVLDEKLVYNPATGNFINPEYFVGATSSMPLYTGAGNTLSQIGTGLGSLGSNISNVMPGDVLMSNPLGYGKLALDTYGTMNQSQAPLQPSAMQNAQQLIGQPNAVPTPQFNSLLQASRRPILIG